MERETFTTNQVAAAAKVSLRQLQWWDERKIVSPRHEGHRRVYNEADFAEIKLISELRRKGCSLQKIRNILRRPTVRAQLQVVAHEEAYLFTDGVRASVELARDAVLDWITRSSKPVILVLLGSVPPALPPPSKSGYAFRI
jgi:DNA-binding transcriptional MerR regulator